LSKEISERNKRVVDRFFKEVMHESANPDLDKLDELVHEDYIQHNPLAGQGRAGLRNFIEHVIPTLEGDAEVFKSPLLKINLIADGDMVVRQEIRQHWMLVDVFRVEDGWLMEHWEAWHFEPGTERPSYMKF
jgi:predicted SnoaL-like aldol condensation-catalyzing enzyme